MSVPSSHSAAEKSPSLYFRALPKMLPNMRLTAELFSIRTTRFSGRDTVGVTPPSTSAA